MRLLLDTHAFLWFINDSPELSATARNLMEDSSSDLLLSHASVWEMAIKISLGKLDTPQPFDQFIDTQLQANQIALLHLSVQQIARLVTLPFHHRDPFDRLLAVQALNENLPLLSRDSIFDAYGVQRLWM
jgi:PIN domain nuclease of toxin-antitoxin system